MAAAGRRGLGRGLGSLIPSIQANSEQNSAPEDRVQRAISTPPESRVTESLESREIENVDLNPVSGAFFAELPVDEIVANPVNPRSVFVEEDMEQLIASIKEVGLLQPIVVRSGPKGGYELVMGERRWRATKAAGLAYIPAIVRETDDTDMLRDALLENLHRSQLNPLEEAAAYQQLLEDFECTHEELASRIGRSRPQITNTLRLLKLSPVVQGRVASGVLSAGHARALLAIEDSTQQELLAARVEAEGISVRGIEEIVALATAADETPRVRRPRKAAAPELEKFAGRLGDRLDARVKVDMGASKGRITIECGTLEDLERIVGLLDQD